MHPKAVLSVLGIGRLASGTIGRKVVGDQPMLGTAGVTRPSGGVSWQAMTVAAACANQKS